MIFACRVDKNQDGCSRLDNVYSVKSVGAFKMSNFGVWSFLTVSALTWKVKRLTVNRAQSSKATHIAVFVFSFFFFFSNGSVYEHIQMHMWLLGANSKAAEAAALNMFFTVYKAKERTQI